VELDFGESFECELPLKFTAAALAGQAELQVGFRTSLGVKFFSVPIDIAAVIQSAGEIGVRQFEALWAQSPAEVRVELEDAKAASAATLIVRSMSVVRDQRGCCEVGFCLPPSFSFCARIAQSKGMVAVVVRGEAALLPIIRANASALFCA
jgi:hypothetical protein